MPRQLAGLKQLYSTDLNTVSSVQTEGLGTHGHDNQGNEYVFLQGTASMEANDWVVYDENYIATRLVADEVGPVAIAATAVGLNQFGWFQVKGIALGNSDTISADSSLYIDATAGRVDDLSVSGDLIIGAYSMTASVSNKATCYITYPHVSNDLTGGTGSGTLSGDGTANQVTFYTGTTTLSSSSNFTFDGSRVGIGKTASTASLEILGTGSNTGGIALGSGANTPQWYILNNGNQLIFSGQTSNENGFRVDNASGDLFRWDAGIFSIYKSTYDNPANIDTTLLSSAKTFNLPDVSGTLTVTSGFGNDNAIVRWDGTSGSLQNTSGWTINDNNGVFGTVSAGGGTIALSVAQNDTGNTRAVLITNSSTANALVIDQNGNAQVSTSAGGALLVDNTDSTGAGVIIYSNQASPSGRLLNVRADNSSFNQDVVHIDNDGTADALSITTNSGASNAISITHTGVDHSVNIGYTGVTTDKGALNLTSTNGTGSVFQVSGVENAKGTIKVTHTGTGDDADAAAISVDLAGANTACQGLAINSTSAGATGALLNLRGNTLDKFKVNAQGTVTVGAWQGSAVAVTFGGTGASSFTATAVILGGATSTSALTTVSGLGSAGQVLTSNGASLAPTWQTPAASSGGTSEVIWWIDAADFALPDSGFAARAKYGTSWVNTVLDFDASTDEQAFYKVQLPNGASVGTVTIDLIWTAATGFAAATSSAVVWTVEFRPVDHDEAFDANSTPSRSTTVITSLLTANNDVIISTGTLFEREVGTAIAGDLLQISIQRDASNAGDNLTSDARLFGACIRMIQS